MIAALLHHAEVYGFLIGLWLACAHENSNFQEDKQLYFLEKLLSLLNQSSACVYTETHTHTRSRSVVCSEEVSNPLIQG